MVNFTRRRIVRAEQRTPRCAARRRLEFHISSAGYHVAPVDLFEARFAFPARFRFRGRCRSSEAPSLPPGECSSAARIAASSAATSRSCVFFTAEEFRQPFVEPAGVDFTAQEIADRGECARRRPVFVLIPVTRVFLEGAIEARDRLRAVLAPGDQLAEHRIVFGRNGKTFVDAVIETDSGAGRRAARKNFPGRRKKLVVGILRVEAAFDGVARKPDVLLRKRKRLSRGDADLQLHQIEPRDHFRDRMFHLQARIHFQKIKIAPRRPPEIPPCPRSCSPLRFARRTAASPMARRNSGVMTGDGRFLDHFLVPPLDRTFALAEMHDVAVRVAENLNFDVARTVDDTFRDTGARRQTRSALPKRRRARRRPSPIPR